MTLIRRDNYFLLHLHFLGIWENWTFLPGARFSRLIKFEGFINDQRANDTSMRAPGISRVIFVSLNFDCKVRCANAFENVLGLQLRENNSPRRRNNAAAHHGAMSRNTRRLSLIHAAELDLFARDYSNIIAIAIRRSIQVISASRFLRNASHRRVQGSADVFSRRTLLKGSRKRIPAKKKSKIHLNTVRQCFIYTVGVLPPFPPNVFFRKQVRLSLPRTVYRITLTCPLRLPGELSVSSS